MKVARIGHAGLQVTAGDTSCVMDPLLVKRVVAGLFEVVPKIDIDLAKLRSIRHDAIIISHFHFDHFCLNSLDLFDRSIPVYVPRGAHLIVSALKQIGFETVRELKPFERTEIGALNLVPTPSKVSFPEMGMVFLDRDGRSFWNIADSIVDDETISGVKSALGRVGLLFAPYQPFLDGLAQPFAMRFPIEEYAAHVRNALAIDPEFLVPSASGLLCTLSPWVNDWMFPMSEQRFLEDILAGSSGRFRACRMLPGSEMDLARDFSIREGALDLVRVRGTLEDDFDWRPDRGFPALSDTDPFGVGAPALKSRVMEFLDRRLLTELQQRYPATLLERLGRMRAGWRLETCFPDGNVDVRFLSFREDQLAWERNSGKFPSIHTTVTASGILGMLEGHLHTNAFRIGGFYRFSSRLYDVYPQGLVTTPEVREPLLAVLSEGALERYVRWTVSQVNARRAAA